MIISGRMRERVTVLAPADVQSTTGEATLDWAPVRTVWAQARNLTGRDYFAAQQAGTLTTHRFLMRFFDGLQPTYRLLWRGRTMEITSIIEAEDRREHEVFAREVV